MEGKLSPPGAHGQKRASSNCSIDLPQIKQEPIDTYEEEKKGGSCLSEPERSLREALRQAQAQTAKTQQELENTQTSMMSWVEKAATFDNLRLAAEGALRVERKKTEEMNKLNDHRINQTKQLMRKFEAAMAKSMEHAQAASDALTESERLKEERNGLEIQLAISKGELNTARQAHITAEELLKEEKKKKNPMHEHAALEWKHKELERVHVLVKSELEEAKKSIGLLKSEKDELNIDMEMAKAAGEAKANEAKSETSAEMVAKIAELESSNDHLRSLLEQVSKKEKPAVHDQPPVHGDNEHMQRIITKNVQSQRTIDDLQAQLDDANDRLQKMANRLERERNERGTAHVGAPNQAAGPFLLQNRFQQAANIFESDAKTIENLWADVRHLRKVLADSNNAKKMLETSVEELRATLKELKESNFQLETDRDLLRSRTLHLQATINDLRKDLETNSKEAKECAETKEKLDGLNALVDEMEQQKAKEAIRTAKEKQDMEEEIEELREKNVALANVSSKKLREQLNAALKEVEELKSELSKPGPIKDDADEARKNGEKGKRIIVEEVAPPSFMLRATAPPVPPPEKKEKGRKRGFRPIDEPVHKKQNTGTGSSYTVERPVEHSIFERPHMDPKVRDKIKFKLI